MGGDFLPRRAGLTPEKITREHQQRLAIIYIRQSTPQQVERNQESTKLQYALVDRAFHFGWTCETIVTITATMRPPIASGARIASLLSCNFASSIRPFKYSLGAGVNAVRSPN